MKILAVSDIENSLVYSPNITERFKGTDITISCGDLSHDYLDYIASMLNTPLYYINGNHSGIITNLEINEKRRLPPGGVNIHRRLINAPGNLLIAGIEGSLRYNYGPYQYTQSDMWMLVFSLVPGMMINHIRFGRFLDIFVTHSPPWKIHDRDDRPHQGIKAFRWFDSVFHPAVHFHGHVHLYHQVDKDRETNFNKTRILNCCGYCHIELNPGE